MKAFLLTASLLAIAGTAAAGQTPPQRDTAERARAACGAAGPEAAAERPGSDLRATPLGELPRARHELTVMKSVNGCPVAVTKIGDRTYDIPIPSTGRGLKPLDATPRRR